MAAESVSCASCQDVTEQERYAQLDDVLTQYQDVPGALIPVLQIAQAIFGYLPDAALRRISVALGKSYSEVAGVVGFYSFFTTVPRGRTSDSRVSGDRLLRARGQERARRAAQHVAGGSRRDDAGPAVFTGRRSVLSAPADWRR